MADLFERAAQELLRAIRGERSQIAFARRLGYRANPVTDWENGRRFPTIDEALRAARLVQLPVQDAFEKFAPIAAPWGCESGTDAAPEIARWLSELRGSRSLVELAEHTGKSRYAVSRWLSGKTEPRLPDFLRLLDALTARLHDWVNFLVPIENVPSLYGRYAQIEAARRLALERPWSEALLRVLETSAYRKLPKHADRHIAELLGIAEEDVASLLAELVEAGIVEKARRRYRVVENLTVETKGSDNDLRDVRRHWGEVGLRRLAEGHKSDWFAYNVIAVSRADSERIEQRLRAAYREVRGIVADSAPQEVASLLTMQLVRW